MLTIKKLAQSIGVSSDAIRHYTNLGFLKPTVNPWTGYRTYSLSDALIAGSIRTLRSLEFSLPEVELYQHESVDGKLDHLEKRRRALCQEIETLQLKLHRLNEVHDFVRKTALCHGVVEVVERPPIYRLCTMGRDDVDYSAAKVLAPAWAAQLPFIHFTIKIPRAQLNDPSFRGTYTVELGLGITENCLKTAQLSTEPPVERVPAGQFLIIYLKTRDVLHLTTEELLPLRRKASELGTTFLDDSTGRLLAIEHTPEGPLYDILVRVRIEPPLS